MQNGQYRQIKSGYQLLWLATAQGQCSPIYPEHVCSDCSTDDGCPYSASTWTNRGISNQPCDLTDCGYSANVYGTDRPDGGPDEGNVLAPDQLADTLDSHLIYVDGGVRNRIAQRASLSLWLCLISGPNRMKSSIYSLK